ncbi:efflux transporter outer membrane subunit [Sphingomonas sp. QA11]|uniref:efflux transporter outer membrane subunit n=1 Tax=Sphingomonas sp. QA11 TaxID=2950605 RepID=UPI00234B51D7|nr:efflux transporter outer membrane subunit [Sphingomonas sp. QA11]WCM26241.1 efflux transporter outer membrane subunit [Sphingomonas sp. QA11]
MRHHIVRKLPQDPASFGAGDNWTEARRRDFQGQLGTAVEACKLFIAAIPLGIVCACGVSPPSTVMPPTSLPSSFPGELSPEGNISAGRLCWRDFLPADLTIGPLVERAIDHNRDLAIATARIDEARALLRQRRIENGLNVQSNVEATINRTTSGATAAGALLEKLFPEVSEGIGLPNTATYPLYRSTLAISSFELDLWGRLRNLSAAARARVLASEWNRKAVQLALLREIVSQSLRKLEIGEQRHVTQRLLAFENERLDILELRETKGLSAPQDVLAQRERITEVDIALSQFALDETGLTNTLEFLTGGSGWTAPDQAAGSPWASRARIDAGLPSRLLLLRPDIRTAESNLLAMRADLSAVRARLFPSINLTGLFGFASSDLGSLFSGNAMVFSGGGMIDLPIFDRPARLANIDLTKARERQAVAEYQKAVESGFREVKDALAARRWYAIHAETIARQVAAISAQVEIAKEQEQAGLTSGLDTIAVERRLLEARVRQVSNSARLAEADFAVFVSLGGGDQMCGKSSTGR